MKFVVHIHVYTQVLSGTWGIFDSEKDAHDWAKKQKLIWIQHYKVFIVNDWRTVNE